MKHQLDFEKPIIELQNKLEELRQHPEKHSLGISFEEEAISIEVAFSRLAAREVSEERTVTGINVR